MIKFFQYLHDKYVKDLTSKYGPPEYPYWIKVYYWMSIGYFTTVMLLITVGLVALVVGNG